MYRIEDFVNRGLFEKKPGAEFAVEIFGGKVITHLKVPSRISYLLNHPKGPSHGEDYSRQDSAVITSLLNSGLSAADTYATFINSPRGKDAFKRKEGHAEDYVKRTIQKAVGFLKFQKSGSVVDVDFSHTSFISSLTSGTADIVSFDKVESEKVRWLWNTRIPLGKVTVLAGDPGVGKSAMMLDIMSTISRGGAFPDGQRAAVGNSVIASAEDGLGDTLRPRLEAAQANLNKVYALRFIVNDENRVEPLSLVDHLTELDQMIKKTSAQLVVIDPFNAYLPSAKVNTYKDQDIRGVMGVLTELAQNNLCSIVLIMHLNKKEEISTLYRIGGSIGIIAAARSALIVILDEADKTKRIVASIKTNLSLPSQPYAYQIEKPEGSDIRIRWLGPVDFDPSTKQSFKGKRDESAEFLQQVLEDSQMPVDEVFKEAKKAGISTSTLRRAKETLGVHSKKIGNIWYWELPS